MIIDEKEVLVSGHICKVARLQAEHYEWIDDPHAFLAKLRTEGRSIDVFTFVQRIMEKESHKEFLCEIESISVLPVNTYEIWWKKQINDKTRNMIRKAGKSGVSVQVMDFTEDLVRGIKEIYDESPMRQGKPFKHYRKDLVTVKNDHSSFLDRSQFLGAYHQGELIAFAKIVHDLGVSHLMQIISKVSHYSRAPTNALIAKAVEICAERSIPYLHYGLWSKRGLGEFKKNHAFEKFELRRYYVPLTRRGYIYLRLNMHMSLSDRLPESILDTLAVLRSRCYMLKRKL